MTEEDKDLRDGRDQRFNEKLDDLSEAIDAKAGSAIEGAKKYTPLGFGIGYSALEKLPGSENLGRKVRRAKKLEL